MNQFDQPVAEHQDVWELLPWFVNGRLSEPDRHRVDAHLGVCDACRDEFAAQRRIYQAISADVGVERIPMAGLNRLRRRLDGAEAEDPAAVAAPVAAQVEPRHGSSGGQPWRQRRGMLAASLAAMATVVGVSAAFVWTRFENRIAPAAYYTVTSAMPQPAGAAVRAVFAPTITLSDLQALLDEAHLKIVAGPTEAGVYSLAMTGSPSAEWSLQRLRAHEAVRFAESIGATSAGPSQ